ncbi:hypothetical protein DXG01_013051 [Tephrocybe rancida]|nr:hypothetical protein DXG01_013051 [Tephrocybe rancida]
MAAPSTIEHIHHRVGSVWSSTTAVAIRTTRRSHPSEDVWLNNLITTAEALCDASDIVAFPPLKTATSLVVKILQTILAVWKNAEDFKDVSQKLLDVIITIRKKLRSFPQDRPLPTEFTAKCHDFTGKLLNLQMDINKTVREAGHWTCFFKAKEIVNAIAQYKEQINDFRENFALGVVVGMYQDMYESCIPHHLSYTVNLLHFVDAMNNRIPVPVDQCSNPEDFDAYVKLRFRKRLGHEIVDRGEYTLSLLEVTGREKLLQQTSKVWSHLVRPGVTIMMGIVLTSQTGDMDNKKRRCPLCNPQCATFFQVSLAINEGGEPPKDLIKEPEGHMMVGLESRQASTAEDVLRQYLYFRRFHIFLEALGDVPGAPVKLPPDHIPSALTYATQRCYVYDLNKLAMKSCHTVTYEYLPTGPPPNRYWTATLFLGRVEFVPGPACASKRGAQEAAAIKAIETFESQGYII